jgi:ABC-type antimicrobial peptide transport system permease subunit
MNTLFRDIQLAVRSWRRRPLLAAIVVLTLALGISATTLVMSLVNAVLLAPLPYGHPERLAVVRAGLPGPRQALTQLSGPELAAVSERARSVRTVGGVWARPGVMGAALTAIEIEIGWITPGFLEAFDVAPQLGRFPLADEHLRTDVIVLSDGLWRQRFGGDVDIIGRRIEFDREQKTVVGVMPRGFRMLFPAEDGVPESMQAWLPWGAGLNEMSRGFRVFTVVARLHDGVNVDALRMELASLATSIAAESTEYAIAHHQSPQRTMYPTLRTSGDPRAVIEQLQAIVQTLEPGLPAFDIRLASSYVSAAMSQNLIAMIALGIFAAVAIIVAGAGVFAALAASVSQRQREIGVRLALGASPSSVYRWIMAQGLALAATGVAGGLLCAALVTRILATLLVGVSPTDPATMLSVSLLVIAIASLACAVPARRAAAVDPCESLKSQ